MIQPGRSSLRRVAVVGGGTAGSLAAANVSNQLRDSDLEFHHIYDSRIPVIGVGEGSWPSLVQQLQEFTQLPHELVQQRLKGTRKYGVAFEGWGRLNQDFIHYFTPQQVCYAYHLSADLLVDLLKEAIPAEHIDANVTNVTREGDQARVDFECRPSEHYDLVFDARGFPKELDPTAHFNIPFIPTNTAIIRRAPSIIEEPPNGPVLQHTYTRAVARKHGWVFVIPLTAHTSYGYIFNRDISDVEDVNADFDELLDADGVDDFESRATIPFPNFLHREMYDGVIARIGNAGAFMEPLEATAIGFTQMEIGMALHMRLNRPIEMLNGDAPMVNRFLINYVLANGMFVGWHYCQGSKYDSEFWQFAKHEAWPQYKDCIDQQAFGGMSISNFEGMVNLINQAVIEKSEWETRRSGFPLTSYAQMAQGLGC